MAGYINGLEAIIGTKRLAARASQFPGLSSGSGGSVIGADGALVPAPQSSVTQYLRSVGALEQPDIKDGVTTLAGAAAGGILWREHRVLGLISGASIGRNGPALLDGTVRQSALCNMGQTAAGVAGSLLAPGAPILGFIIGHVAGGAVIHFGGLRK